MSENGVADQLQRYGEWIEREAGHPLRAPVTAAPSEAPVVEAAGRSRWAFLRPPRPAFVGLAAATLLVVVAAMVTLRPAGDPSALYTRVDDPEGPLFVLPEDTAGYVVSGGIVRSETVGAPQVTGRLWIGTPDESGTTFRDVVQVCALRVAAECTSLPTPSSSLDRIEIDGRFVPVATSDDGSIVVVSERRGLLYVAVRAAGASDPVELAALLDAVVVDADGTPSADVEGPRVVFAAQGNIAPTRSDPRYSTSFDVDDRTGGAVIGVSTVTGTPEASRPEIIPAGVELDEVSFTEGIIDGVTVTELTFAVPGLGTVRSLVWQASPTRLVIVGGPGASSAQLIDVARSLDESSEADWEAALPSHRLIVDGREVVDD